MRSTKKTNTLKGVALYISDILPSPEEIRDEIGNFISQLLCGPGRWENRAEIRKRLVALKDTLTGVIDKESVLTEIVCVLDKLEAFFDEALGGAKKDLKKARLLTLSLAFALGAIILDRRWKAFFDTVV